MLIKRSGVDREVREKAKFMAERRRQQDVEKGLSRAKGPQRGDFDVTKKYDKVIQDYRKFKGKDDRRKIQEEYYGRQKEYQKHNREA